MQIHFVRDALRWATLWQMKNETIVKTNEANGMSIVFVPKYGEFKIVKEGKTIFWYTKLQTAEEYIARGGHLPEAVIKAPRIGERINQGEQGEAVYTANGWYTGD